MYKAPIEILSAKMAEYKLNTETMVMEAVFETGINVDRDELIRALRYDREQYDKGYADGKAEAAREIFEEIEYLIWQNDTFLDNFMDDVNKEVKP